MPNPKSSQANSKQKQRTGSSGTADSSHDNCIKSGSNNYSDSTDENNDKFILQKNINTSKRNLSSTSIDSPNPEPKKFKPLFITVNRFTPLLTDNTVMGNTENYPTSHDNKIQLYPMTKITEENFHPQFMSVVSLTLLKFAMN